MLEIYAGLMLFKAGKEINEENVKKVLEAAGAKVDDAKVKALVASLDGVNIEQKIKEAVVVAPAQVAEEKPAEEKKEEKKEEDEKKSQESAAQGLGALFGLVWY